MRKFFSYGLFSFCIALQTSHGQFWPLMDPESAPVCSDIIQQLTTWDHISLAMITAQVRHPENPIERSMELRRQLASKLRDNSLPFTLRPPRQLSVRRGRRSQHTFTTYAWIIPETKMGRAPELRALVDFELNTIRYVCVRDQYWDQGKTFFATPQKGAPMEFKQFKFWPNRHSQAVVSWSAGLTGLASNAGRVFSQLKTMNSLRTNGLTAQILKGSPQPLWFPTSAVTADVPFHGSGPAASLLLDLESSIDWRRRYYQSLKTTGLPLIAASRSGESLLLGETDHQNPGLFDGMIWMSPMHPTQGYAQSLEGYRTDAVNHGVPLNPLAFEWFSGIRNQIVQRPAPHWWESLASDANGTPVLILVGELDQEVSEQTRAAFRLAAVRNPSRVFYVEVPGAGHDLFAVTEDTDGNQRRWTAAAEIRAANTWRYVYWFLRSKVLKQEGVPLPEMGWLAGQG